MTAPVATGAIVIGGGIVGAATALFLRRHKISVTILERDRAATRASAVNFGGVRQNGRDLREIPLSRRARRIWNELPSLIGTAGEFAATGNLRLARTPEAMAELEQFHRGATALGLPLELLDEKTMRQRFPWLGGTIVGGSVCPEDGQANPRLVSPAFLLAARAAGAELHEEADVIEATHDSGGFRILTCDGREFRAPVLVNAAGAWAGHIAGWFGEPVALRPEVPQVMVTEPTAYCIGPVLGVVGGDLYLRQIPRGNIIFGGGEGLANEGFTLSRPLPQTTKNACRRAVEAVPLLATVPIIRSWTGVDGTTADGAPVVGPSAHAPGLFHAFGFCGHGFQIGPAVGAVVAELIALGNSPTPIVGLGIERFASA